MTKELAGRYRRASKAAKGVMLDELCALTGWHRDSASRALRAALQRQVLPRGVRSSFVRAWRPRRPLYDEAVIDAARLVWSVLDAPCGKRLQAVMAETVAALERHGGLRLDAAVRAKLRRDGQDQARQRRQEPANTRKEVNPPSTRTS